MKRRTHIYIILVILIFGASAHAITLDEGLDIASKNNPQLISAKKKLEIADARLGQGRSFLMPTVSVSGSFGKTYTQPAVIDVPGMGSFSTSPDNPADLSSYSVSLNQILFNGGALNGMAMAYYSYLSAKEDLRKARMDLVYNVSSAYFGVIKAENTYKVADDSLKSLKRYYGQMKLMYDAGIVSTADLLRVQTQYESAKQYEILARSGVRIAKISMNSVLGLPLTSETTVVIQERKNNEKIPQINDLLKTAYENRPDWISFKLAEQTADAGINVAYSGFLPTFTLSGSYGRNIVKYPEEYQDSNSNLLSWKALITGSWTLFDGLNTPNKVYEAQANLDYTKAQGKIMNDAVALDVTSTYYELTSNIERAASARSAEEMSRKMMKLAEMNFEQKIYSTIQLMDAQTVYQKARTDMIAAENDLELSKIKLSRSVGKDLWTASNPKK